MSLETQWRREDADRLLLVASCLGSLKHLIEHPDAPHRETRIAQAVADLQIALHGDDVARAELHAHNDENVRRVLDYGTAGGGDPR